MKAIVNKTDLFGIFGGESKCRANYPKTYEAINNTGFQNVTEPVPTPPVNMENQNKVSMEILAVIPQKYVPTKVAIIADFVLENDYTEGYFLFQAEAIQKSTGKVLNSKNILIWFSKKYKENGAVLELQIEKALAKDSYLDLTGGPVNNEGAFIYTARYDLSKYDIVESKYEIKHPRRRDGHPDSDPNINLFFWRSPTKGEFVDYKYENAYDLFCESEGCAYAEGYPVKRIDSANLFLQYSYEHISYDDVKSKIALTEKGIEWNGIKGWKKRIDTFMSKNEGLVDYYLSVVCILEDQGDIKHTFLISNTGSNPILPPMKMYFLHRGERKCSLRSFIATTPRKM